MLPPVLWVEDSAQDSFCPHLHQSDLEGPQQKGNISLRCVSQARTMYEYAMS